MATTTTAPPPPPPQKPHDELARDLAAIADPAAAQLARSLQAYIRPRSEALRIRRALTAFLAAQVTFPQDTGGGNLNLNPRSAPAASHALLCNPDTAVSAKHAPPELPPDNLHQQYLAAVRANAVARSKYRETVKEVAGVNNGGGGGRGTDGEDGTGQGHGRHGWQGGNAAGAGLGVGGDPLQAWVALARNQRDKARLEIYHESLGQLSRAEGSRYGYLSLADELAAASQLIRSLASATATATAAAVPSPRGDGGAADGSCEQQRQEVGRLMERLEKATVQARLDAELEAASVERLRKIAAAGGGDGGGEKANAGESEKETARLRALARTRDELARWVQETLATTPSALPATGSVGGTGGDTDGAGIGTSTRDLLQEGLSDSQVEEERRAVIMDQYDAYLESREALLSTVKEFLRPMPEPAQPARRARERQPSIATEQGGPPTPAAHATVDMPSTVAYISNLVNPLARALAASDLQRKHLSAQTVQVSARTLRMLDRLQVESQLLHEYSAHDDGDSDGGNGSGSGTGKSSAWRQQHRRAKSTPVGAVAGRRRPSADPAAAAAASSSSSSSSSPEAEIARRTAAWTAAASKAGQATASAVAELVAAGAKSVRAARGT
ncbi:hypothetical protein KEM52_002503, partial [Ascosphaera acerosa]